MSLLSRYATRAVQRENERLTERIAKLADDLRKANRDLGAANERNTQHIRNAIRATENALALGNAYDKVRAEYDRVVDALTFVTAERDQALADKVALEEELDACHNWMCEPAKDLRSRLKLTCDVVTYSHAERDRLEDKLARLGNHEACEQRTDRDRAEIERLEQELRTLAADHLEASGRLADAEERLGETKADDRTYRGDSQAMRVELAKALNLPPFVTTGQRYDLEDVRDEKRSMDRGEE